MVHGPIASYESSIEKNMVKKFFLTFSTSPRPGLETCSPDDVLNMMES